MRSRALLWASLAVNAALATMVILLNRNVQEADTPMFFASAGRGEEGKAPAPHVVVRRIPFTWSDIESKDYPTYIRNLRQIGCPEETIRDIIVADVNELFAQRQQTEVITYEHEWWRNDPSVGQDWVLREKADALDNERRALLTALLGAGWDRGSMPPVPQLSMREAFVASLTDEQRASLSGAFQQYRAALQETSATNQPPGAFRAVALRAKAEENLKGALALFLSPQQVEDALVRYSAVASQMRRELAGFEPTREEFLQIFRTRQQHQALLAGVSGDEHALESAVRRLERAEEETLRQTLGPERFPLYQLSQDSEFREAQASVEKIGGPAERVIPLFQLNKAIEETRQQIGRNTQLTSGERAAALQEASDEHQSALKTLLGEEAYAKYNELSNAVGSP